MRAKDLKLGTVYAAKWTSNGHFCPAVLVALPDGLTTEGGCIRATAGKPSRDWLTVSVSVPALREKFADWTEGDPPAVAVDLLARADQVAGWAAACGAAQGAVVPFPAGVLPERFRIIGARSRDFHGTWVEVNGAEVRRREHGRAVHLRREAEAEAIRLRVEAVNKSLGAHGVSVRGAHGVPRVRITLEDMEKLAAALGAPDA